MKFCSFMLEWWKVNETLQFVKVDVIEGLDNENDRVFCVSSACPAIPPILIPF